MFNVEYKFFKSRFSLLISPVFNIVRKIAWGTKLIAVRFGLPVNFQAMILMPNKKQIKKLRWVRMNIFFSLI